MGLVDGSCLELRRNAAMRALTRIGVTEAGGLVEGRLVGEVSGSFAGNDWADGSRGLWKAGDVVCSGKM